MLGIVNFQLFLVSAILLNLTPGTDTIYIVSRSVSQGKKAGIYSALGINSGAIIHTLLAAFGLSIILMNSATLFQIVKMVGVLYLAFLGVKMLLSKKTGMSLQTTIENMPLKKIYLQGLITNFTNPKVALFFLAFIPQFTEPSSGHLPFVILGLTFCVTGGIWNLIIANVASFTTKKLRNNSNVEFILNKLTGVIFIAMGVKLFKTKATQ
jgi:threonine/homoserine/homoserine lactone efflux protein